MTGIPTAPAAAARPRKYRRFVLKCGSSLRSIISDPGSYRSESNSPKSMRFGSDSVIRRCRVQCPICPKADMGGQFMSTRPNLELRRARLSAADALPRLGLAGGAGRAAFRRDARGGPRRGPLRGAEVRLRAACHGLVPRRPARPRHRPRMTVAWQCSPRMSHRSPMGRSGSYRMEVAIVRARRIGSSLHSTALALAAGRKSQKCPVLLH
jgi:hypothetical protein